jgi:hypothetical protein
VTCHQHARAVSPNAATCAAATTRLDRLAALAKAEDK